MLKRFGYRFAIVLISFLSVIGAFKFVLLYSKPTNAARTPATSTFNLKVYLINFNPQVTIDGNTQSLQQYFGWSDVNSLSNQIINFFKTTTSNRVNYSITQNIVDPEYPQKTDGFIYNQTSYFACMSDHATCHDPDMSNYAKIMNANQICRKVNAGEIDEVWMFGAPYFGFSESGLIGPNTYGYNGILLEDNRCNKLVPIMGFSYERELNEAIHDFGHRTEATMSQVYGGWGENRTNSLWDLFGLVRSQSPSYIYAGCGSIHYTPNSTNDSTDAYIYDININVNSACEAFLNPQTINLNSPPLTSLNCSAWGCNEIGYYAWWFGHLPAVDGALSDGRYADWWEYFAHPGLANTPLATFTPTATLTATPTITVTPTPTDTVTPTPTDTPTPTLTETPTPTPTPTDTVMPTPTDTITPTPTDSPTLTDTPTPTPTDTPSPTNTPTPQPTVDICITRKSKGDYNCDSKVDLSDLSILAAKWQTFNTIADSNSDGKTDLSDLSILAANWNKGF